MAIASKTFSDIVAQTKCDNDLYQGPQGLVCIMDSIFYDNYKIFEANYHSSFAIFDFFDNFFLRLQKLTQTSYTQFLINTKLQNNKSKMKYY